MLGYLAGAARAGTNQWVLQTVAEAREGQLAALAKDLDAQATAIRDMKTADPSAIIWLAAARQFAHYFGGIDAPTTQQKQILAWLAAQPRLMPTLMSAVGERDLPARVLEILQMLGAGQNPKLDEFADLTTAMAVVWDKPPAKDSTRHRFTFEADHAARLFAYFTNPHSPMRFDLRQLCWQMQTFIVDLKISDDEIGWAASRYASNYSIPSLYFDVTYDEAAFYQGDEKKIAAHDYTLPNILQYGGVCVEQAYFAEEVAKSLGIPACICVSRGGGAGGVAHAWLGIVNPTNRQLAWDFDQGRYKEDLFWSAEIINPQTHEILSDADVALLGALQKVDADTRLFSALLLRLSDVLPADQDFGIAVREVQVSPGNRPAWNALAAMGADNKLSAAQNQIVETEIRKSLLGPYPDFACQTLMRMVSGQEMMAQVMALDQLAALFPARPDLRARIRLRQADLLMQARKDAEAFRALDDVLTNELDAGAIVLQAMKRTDTLMRAHNNLAGLAQVYAQTWPHMPAPNRSAYVYWTPYYVVGKAYLDLLTSLGNQPAAAEVRNRLVAIIPDGAQLR
jgi:hypothetical protein